VINVKVKFGRIMEEKQMGLGVLFKYLDKDGSKDIDEKEFVTRMAQFLDGAEATTLFKAIDIDCSGEITKQEFLSELSAVNCQYYLNGLSKVVKQGCGDYPKAFESYAGTNDRMEASEFK
jgi:Ca2+-binding EF-hand superfamily protein